MHLTEVREAESRMALIFLKTVALTGRARRAPPEDRSSVHVGIVAYQKRYGGDLNLSLVAAVLVERAHRQLAVQVIYAIKRRSERLAELEQLQRRDRGRHAGERLWPLAPFTCPRT